MVQREGKRARFPHCEKGGEELRASVPDSKMPIRAFSVVRVDSPDCSSVIEDVEFHLPVAHISGFVGLTRTQPRDHVTPEDIPGCFSDTWMRPRGVSSDLVVINPP